MASASTPGEEKGGFWDETDNKNENFFDLGDSLEAYSNSDNAPAYPVINFDGSKAPVATYSTGRNATKPSQSIRTENIDNAPLPQSSLSKQVTKKAEDPRPLRPTALEVSGLEAAVNCYISTDRDLVESRGLSTSTPATASVQRTIRNIILGEPFILEPFKSIRQKTELLDAAIKSGDGNSITAAVLFMSRTLKQSLFVRELQSRPEALSHYLAFLHAHYEHDEYEQILLALGRHDAAAMFRYRLACKSSSAERRKNQVRSVLTSHFAADPGLTVEAGLLRQHVQLIETQLPVEAADMKAAQERAVRVKSTETTEVAPLAGLPLITTLYYCCLNHYKEAENNLASPSAIRKQFNLNEKQFLWTALLARGRAKSWDDIHELFITKNWMGSMKLKQSVKCSRVVGALSTLQAPVEILSKYLVFMEDLDERWQLARSLQCHRVAVDALVAMRDRSLLQHYAASLPSPSASRQYAEHALQSSTIKWKR